MKSADQITIKNDSLYISAELYEKYFSTSQHVAIISEPPDLLVLPIRHVGNGGLLVKIRNQHGDRIINAPDALRTFEQACTEHTDVTC